MGSPSVPYSGVSPALLQGDTVGAVQGTRLGWGEMVPAREQHPTHPLSSASCFQNKLFTPFSFLFALFFLCFNCCWF